MPHLLIVEDDKFITELYQHQLLKYGISSKVASDIDQGKKLAEEEGFDLVLLDLKFEKSDGFEFLRFMKAHEKLKKIPVVVLSNYGQDDIMKKALALGAKAFIIKGLYTPEQVVEEVRSFI